MNIAGLITGTHTYLVGVEDDPDGGLRCYLGARSKGLYCVVEDEDAKADVRRAWGGSLGLITIPVPPPKCIFAEADAENQEEVGGC